LDRALAGDFAELAGLPVDAVLMLPPDQIVSWGPVVQHLCMAAYSGNLPQDTFKRGKRIVMYILIRNEDSATPIELEETFAFRDYRVEIIGPSGNPSPLSAAGLKAKAYVERVYEIRSRLVVLELQDVYERQYPLSDWYDLAGPGDYEVRVERPGLVEGGVTLQAPSLRFRIT
jgi:hypothetical protein